MRVSVMQPTYLPWAGYFGLMMLSDYFVFLDDVQFERRGWQQRNYIKHKKDIINLTVPVIKKGLRDQKINQTKIYDKEFYMKHLKTIYHCYSKTPFFNEYFANLKKIYEKKHHCLIDLNIELILFFKDILEINSKTLFSSSFKIENVNKTKRIEKISKKVKANTYIYTINSEKYVTNSNFFKNTDYFFKKFTFDYPGEKLSVLDMIFNHGKNSINLIKKHSKLD